MGEGSAHCGADDTEGVVSRTAHLEKSAVFITSRDIWLFASS